MNDKFWHKLELEEYKSDEMTTSAPRICCICGHIISSNGGGGSFICKVCANLIRKGTVRSLIAEELRKVRSEQSNET